MTKNPSSANTICISEATEYNPDILDAVNRLLPQLDPEARPITESYIRILIQSADSHLFLARVDGTIAAMCTLCVYTSPTGRKVWVEDVVTDKEFRGCGLARQLLRHAIDKAGETSPCTLMLTSRPARKAANKLYQSMGFIRKETNVYKMDIG